MPPSIPPVMVEIRQIARKRLITGVVVLVLLFGAYFIALGLAGLGWQDFSHAGLRTQFVVVAISLIALICGVSYLIEGITWSRDPYRHPALDWPDIGTPAEVAEALDRELHEPGGVIDVKPLWFTRSWMVRHTERWTLDVALLSSIVWAYKKETQRKSYGITISKTYSFLVNTRNGKTFTVEGVKSEQVDSLLVLITQLAPDAVIGYSAELEKLWNGDRPGFLKQIDERKRQREAQPTAPDGVPVPTGEFLV